jgi:hypothetical protein
MNCGANSLAMQSNDEEGKEHLWAIPSEEDNKGKVMRRWQPEFKLGSEEDIKKTGGRHTCAEGKWEDFPLTLDKAVPSPFVGSIKSFGAGMNGAMWGVDGDGTVWRKNGENEKPEWLKIEWKITKEFPTPAKFEKISVGGMTGTSIWAVAKFEKGATAGEIYVRAEVAEPTKGGVGKIEGTKWSHFPIGQMQSVHVGRSGAVWAVDAVGKPWYRAGIVMAECKGCRVVGDAWVALDNADYDAFLADPEKAPVPILFKALTTVSQPKDLQG